MKFKFKIGDRVQEAFGGIETGIIISIYGNNDRLCDITWDGNHGDTMKGYMTSGIMSDSRREFCVFRDKINDRMT